jgi:hypothetical protein
MAVIPSALDYRRGTPTDARVWRQFGASVGPSPGIQRARRRRVAFDFAFGAVFAHGLAGRASADMAGTRTGLASRSVVRRDPTAT